MARQAADLVAQALDLIEQGELTLEKGPARFGEDWPAIFPTVKLALQVKLASNPPLVSTRPYQAPDLSAGWQALQSQLEVTPQLPALPQSQPEIHPVVRWWQDLRRFFATKLGQAVGGSMIGLALSLLLFVGVAGSKPGDLLYKAKLGWEYLGEFVEINPDQKAEVALHYADNRLSELEHMAFVATPDQLTEVQGQYLRAMDAAARYSNNPQFHSFVALYDHLTAQRDRVDRLVQAEYSFGPGARLSYMANRLNDTVFSIAPRLPGAIPPPAATPGPGTPTPPPTQ
ncbi:MAG: hypothetical protein J0I20_02625 [Chloroflexi bacterium]|nr:hypothetical protein [Chloroflexota bacterium]